jgi:hypothetical protein
MKDPANVPKAGLKADAKRQAVPLFKGVDYQIWQTVLAWADLAENETLFVEGAEDFDTIGEAAIGNQIKRLTAPISPNLQRTRLTTRLRKLPPFRIFRSHVRPAFHL